jgi:cell wall-associated NlpC family hydrolase
VDVPEYNLAQAAIKIDDYRAGQIDTQVMDNLASDGWQRLEEPQAPCLVVFALDPRTPGAVNHLGVYIGAGKFFHTMARRMACIERMDHPLFKKRISGFYRYGKS